MTTTDIASVPASAGGDGLTLDAENLTKSYGGVRALTDASIRVRTGSVHALVGDNGAGKSTFVKCLTGVVQQDGGTIEFNGRPLALRTPAEAHSHGIETVYQDLALIEELTVWQNLYLDRELTTAGFLRRGAMKQGSQTILQRLDVNVPSIHAKVQQLSGGQRQCIAIARAVNWGSNLVIMDEPTAALGVRETAAVEKLITTLRTDGITVLLISHDMEQVLRIADRVTVVRRGHDVTTEDLGEGSGVDGDRLVGLITGAIRPDERRT